MVKRRGKTATAAAKTTLRSNAKDDEKGVTLRGRNLSSPPKAPSKKQPAPAARKRVLATKGVRMARPFAVGLQEANAMQLVASHFALQSAGQATKIDPETGDWAKRFAICGVLAALVEKRANPTFLKIGWAGKLKDDYHFTEVDFPVFLDEIARQLLPKYTFTHDQPFDAINLGDTLISLAGAISVVAK